MWDTIFIGLIDINYKSRVTRVEMEAKTEDLEFSVRDRADEKYLYRAAKPNVNSVLG